jgi:hypothetical protein
MWKQAAFFEFFLAWLMQLPGQRGLWRANIYYNPREATMNSPTIIKEKVSVTLSDEVMSFCFKIGAVSAALIGAWALSALVAGLISAGPATMIQNYIRAVSGF